MPTHKRLNFFRKMGAKRIAFDYVAPCSDQAERVVDKLYLLTMSIHTNAVKFIPIVTVMSYLLESTRYSEQSLRDCLYSAAMYEEDKKELERLRKVVDAAGESINLKVKGRAFTDSFKNYQVDGACYPLNQMFLSLLKNVFPGRDSLYLNEIPRTEEPKFKFKRASITIQVLIDEDYFAPVSNILTMENGHWVKRVGADTDDESAWDHSNEPAKRVGDGMNGDHLNRNPTPDWKAELKERTEIRYCTVCHSYETDLFAYQYQVDPPYYTKVFAQDLRVVLRIPDNIAFTSEGRKESYVRSRSWPDPTAWEGEDSISDGHWLLPMRLFVSYSLFDKSNIRVWNLSFSPLEEADVDEFTLIKLAKFFTGTQESKSVDDKNSEILDKIGFAVCEEDMILSGQYQKKDALVFDSLLNQFFPHPDRQNERKGIGVYYELTKEGEERHKVNERNYHDSVFSEMFYDKVIGYKNVKTGIMHVDLSENLTEILTPDQAPHWRKDMESIFGDLYSAIKNRHWTQTTNRTGTNTGDFRTEIANMLCGTTLGIFDYDRMGPEEIEDTLSPRPDSATETSFLTINRGALSAYYTSMDNVLDAAWHSLAASPYLLLPSAVLAHNEYVSIDAEDRLNSLMIYIRQENMDKSKINRIIEERNQISDLLNEQYLPNVYHYKTERDLYYYGSEHRGITRRYKDTLSGLARLDVMVEQLILSRNEKYHQTVQIVLGAIAITTFLSFINDLVNENISRWIIVGGASVVYVLLVLFMKYQFSRSRKSTLGTGNYILDDQSRRGRNSGNITRL